MAKITITEALAEIKTIGARIETKRAYILKHVVRNAALVDPLVEQGGSRSVISSEIQSIRDLNKRIVIIRNAITKANMETLITINEHTMTVHDWLVWRREVATGEKNFLQAIGNGINQARSFLNPQNFSQATSTSVQRRTTVQGSYITEQAPIAVAINIDESQLQNWTEDMENILGTLDGRLSLINATTFVDV